MTDWQTIGTPAESSDGNYIGYSDIDNWASGALDTQKLVIINRVEDLIEQITKDYFYAKAFIIYINGNGKDNLSLGLIPDIISVSEVKLFGVVLSTNWYTYDVNSIYLDPEALSGAADDLAELHLRIKYKAGLFPKGKGNIKITGTYGWTTLPAAIKQAVIILCRFENDETLYSRYDDFATERLGDHSYSRGDKQYLSGVLEADRLLKNYIRRKPVMHAV